MLNPTQKLTEMIATLNGRNVEVMEQALASAVQELTAQAEELGLDFNPELLNTGLRNQFGTEMVNSYFEAQMGVEEARDSREEALKALKIGAGVAIGATVTGLLWREASRRGWTARATQAIRTRQIINFVQKRFGKTAAMAVKMTLAGKVTGVMWVKGTKASYRACKVSLPKLQLCLMTDDDQPIYFLDITRVEISRITSADGATEEVACLVVDVKEAAE